MGFGFGGFWCDALWQLPWVFMDLKSLEFRAWNVFWWPSRQSGDLVQGVCLTLVNQTGGGYFLMRKNITTDRGLILN